MWPKWAIFAPFFGALPTTPVPGVPSTGALFGKPGFRGSQNGSKVLAKVTLFWAL